MRTLLMFAVASVAGAINSVAGGGTLLTFGAGIGILMLAALSLMGHSDIQRMNALKNLLAACMNGAAAIYFVLTANVGWFDAVVMAVGAIIGGAGGAGLALRLGQRVVRSIVIVVGFGSALIMLIRNW